MYIAFQFILAVPIITALTIAAVQGVDPRIKKTAVALGANGFQSFMAIALESRFAIIAAIAGLAVIFIGLLVAIFLGKSISSSITNMTDTVHRITTEQNFNEEIPVNSNNELGLLAQELNTLLQLRETSLNQANLHTSEHIDERNLSTDIAHDLREQLENAIEANNTINNSTTRQHELADEINRSVSNLSASAHAMSDVSNKSDEQKQLISVAVEHIDKSVESTVESIKAITQSSSQIADIIALSTEIAEKTNLLALNASVKAARAGSHGKEFAVIADEIAKLAQRSEEIAKEANQLTTNLNGKVDEAIRLGDESEKSLDHVQEASKLNLIETEELANQAAVIISNTSELDNLSKSLTTTISEIHSTAKEQGLECTTALKTIETLLSKTSTFSNDSKEEENDDETTLNQHVDDIHIKQNDQEESNETSIDITDNSEAETTETELSDDKEFENIDSNKNDNSHGTLT